MPEQHRAFIAIAIPRPVREALGQHTARLSESLGRIRWTAPSRMHFTIKFLGDVEVERTPRLLDTLRMATTRIPPFELIVKGLGAFPHLGRPRVLWAGLAGQTDTLCTLHARTEKALEGAGFPRDDTPFHAHVTIGRVRRGRRVKIDEATLSRGAPEIFGVIPVRELHVIRSVLSSRSPEYNTLGTVGLAGGAGSV